MLSLRCKRSVSGMFYVHTFHLHHLYSTKSPDQSIKSPNESYSKYLVDNLGFSQHEAHSTSTKLPYKYDNYSKFCNNADSVVDFLKQHGFKDAHIKKVVSCYPRILASNVDKTLVPKFQLFQDHGFFRSNPSIVSRNMDPTILDLKAVLGSDENLIKLLNNSNLNFGTTSSIENLLSNVALLNNDYGFHIDVIRNHFLQQPSSFLRKPEFFRNVLVRVEEELGIPRISRMYLYAIHMLTRYSKEAIESKCQVLRSFGWTDYDVSELMRRNPCAFYKSQENIKKRLGFLMTELGYDPDFLASCSSLFTYSLEKRMVPRRRVLLILKEKGLLDYNFCTAIKKTETEFLKILVEPYKEAVPGLLEVYQNSKGSSKVEVVSR